MSADDRQEGGTHYKEMALQPWVVLEDWMSAEEFRGFLLGNAVKYLGRAGKKGPAVEDLRKARHYLDKLIECLEQDAARGVEREGTIQETDRDAWILRETQALDVSEATKSEVRRAVSNKGHWLAIRTADPAEGMQVQWFLQRLREYDESH